MAYITVAILFLIMIIISKCLYDLRVQLTMINSFSLSV